MRRLRFGLRNLLEVFENLKVDHEVLSLLPSRCWWRGQTECRNHRVGLPFLARSFQGFLKFRFNRFSEDHAM